LIAASSKNGKIMKLEHSHERAAIAARLVEGRKPSYVRDFVYGGIDGAITTFAIVAGVVGAALSSKVILILGLANLLADGFSMAASNYSGTKTVVDDLDRIREIEKKHVRLDPDGEREEVRQLLVQKGLEGKSLEDVVESITASEKNWIDLMLTEEYGLSLNQPAPLLAGLATFLAFIICGTVPILPFAFDMQAAFTISMVMTGIVFFLIGAAKSKWALAPWWRSGFETFAIGGVAAAMAYTVGYFLKGLN
jgi:VIT1/CCC1 family predicted Fe2+/Mn2+ transporter